MERRYNYTTPTSFLELINFYKSLLDSKQSKLTDQIKRLEIGLDTMKQTTEQVEGLQKLLVIKMVDVETEKEKTNELIEIVGKESLDAEKEQNAAAVQEEETIKYANAANAEKQAANKELEEAIPAMKAAEEAVACLDKKSIQELKSLANPPAQVLDVAKAVLILRGEKKNHAWGNAQKMMGNPPQFIEMIQKYDGNNIEQWILDALQPILKQDYFTFEIMKSKSQAGAFLCKWVINIVTYNSIYKKVKPLMETAEAAEALANSKADELAIVKEKVRLITEKVDALKAKLEEAEDAKQRVEEEA